MLNSIKKLFFPEKADFAHLVNKGAIILDVRTHAEYSRGHIDGSINIPVDQLLKNLNKFKDKGKPIITCCESGMRSSAAMNILKSNGYVEVYNGGGWSSLKNKI